MRHVFMIGKGLLAAVVVAATGVAVFHAVKKVSSSQAIRRRLADLHERELQEHARRLDMAMHENAGLR